MADRDHASLVVGALTALVFCLVVVRPALWEAAADLRSDEACRRDGGTVAADVESGRNPLVVGDATLTDQCLAPDGRLLASRPGR